MHLTNKWAALYSNITEVGINAGFGNDEVELSERAKVVCQEQNGVDIKVEAAINLGSKNDIITL